VGSKIILGTVQLGIPYGISNVTGQPTKAEAFRILDSARHLGINTLDSADGYGESLEVIGRYQVERNQSFKIINKFKLSSDSFLDNVQKSLEKLDAKTFYCYMYHHFPDYESKVVRAALSGLKQKGVIDKIGVSMYGTEQLRRTIEDPEIDVIQLPINIFDLDQEKRDLLKRAKDRGKEIHARSVYLQGLFFKNVNSLTGNLVALRPYLESLQQLSQIHQIDLKKIALNYVLQKDFIDYVVLGVDNAAQLEENAALIDPLFDSTQFKDVTIDSKNAFLLNPANWKL